MVYAAEKTVAEMEKDPVSKAEADAYTAGVNAYITNLKESELPIEYKLLGYKPELWSNLKTALFLKFMSLDLAGYETILNIPICDPSSDMQLSIKCFPFHRIHWIPLFRLDTISRIPGIIGKSSCRK